jgi:hypothetical protein
LIKDVSLSPTSSDSLSSSCSHSGRDCTNSCHVDGLLDASLVCSTGALYLGGCIALACDMYLHGIKPSICIC